MVVAVYLQCDINFEQLARVITFKRVLERVNEYRDIYSRAPNPDPFNVGAAISMAYRVVNHVNAADAKTMFSAACWKLKHPRDTCTISGLDLHRCAQYPHNFERRNRDLEPYRHHFRDLCEKLIDYNQAMYMYEYREAVAPEEHSYLNSPPNNWEKFLSVCIGQIGRVSRFYNQCKELVGIKQQLDEGWPHERPWDMYAPPGPAILDGAVREP